MRQKCTTTVTNEIIEGNRIMTNSTMFWTLWLLSLTTIIGTWVDAQMFKYCNLRSCRGQPHTLCLFPFLGISSRCGMLQSAFLSPIEIKELLDVHNRLRERVASGKEIRGRPGPQPAARNIGPLVWSTELAAIAQTWANQCNFSHDKCRDTAKFEVGQNVGYYANTGINRGTVSQLVMNWYNEVAIFSKDGVKAYVYDSATGHYTQLIWAKTTQLGCGAVRYNADGEWNTLYLVCNYAPAGNWIGEPIYETK